MSSQAGGVAGVLARLGWALRRRSAAGGLRFVVRRAGRRRGFCELSLPRAEESAPSLTPEVRLRSALRPGTRLTPLEREGLADLRAELGFLLELLRRRPEGAPRGTALAEIHEGREGRDLLLRTTFACNQRCAFCFVPLTGKGSALPEIERALEAQAREPGARGTLTLSGGEPTSDPRLPAIIASARRRGFRRFSLQTNGVYLARPGLLESLVSLGVKSYLFSLHSHRAAAYDEITGTRGQFPRAVAGLTRVLRSPRCNVTVNVVVNARNYRDLPGLVDFVAGLRAGGPREGRHGFYFSMINEVGHQTAPAWTVALEKVAPFLRRATVRCRENGLVVSPSGGESAFPVCLLADPASHAALRTMPQERMRYAEDFSGEAGLLGRAKRPSCRTCPYDSRCAGVPARYARLYGVKALRIGSHQGLR